MILIGGGVMKSAKVIIPYIESYVYRYAWTPWGKVQVHAAELGNNVVLREQFLCCHKTSRP